MTNQKFLRILIVVGVVYAICVFAGVSLSNARVEAEESNQLSESEQEPPIEFTEEDGENELAHMSSQPLLNSQDTDENLPDVFLQDGPNIEEESGSLESLRKASELKNDVDVESTIIINYLDRQGKKLEDSEIITGIVGEKYSIEPKEINGYYSLSKTEEIDGTIENNQKIIDYEYVEVNEILLNQDFEEPVISTNFAFLPQTDVPGWNTTAIDGIIEFGLGPAHNIFGPDSGNQFAELNANVDGELYQLVSYNPGTILRWRLSHAGRMGVDTMALNIGSPENREVILEASSPSGSWSQYSGTYVIPDNQEITYFGFEAIRSSTGNISVGNLLDNIHFGESSELVVTNQVDKSIAQASEELIYSIAIENNGGVPADRLNIKINGLSDTVVNKNSFKIGAQTIEPDKIIIEDETIIISPGNVLENGGSINLSFETKIKQNFTSGEVNTQVEVLYWDEAFDDFSYHSISNNVVTEVITSTPEPVDPLNPEIEVNPENKPDLPEDQGLVSIDFVSQFNFGKQGISVQDQTYYAQPQRLLNEDGTVQENEERPNYVQVSDRRSLSEREGWQLAVTQLTQFSGEDNQELMGAELSLSNQQLASVQGGEEPSLELMNPLHLIPGSRQVLLVAQGNQGTGTWIYRFGDQDTADKSIGLYVPRGATPEATKYSTTLNWELSSVPGN